MSTEQLVATLEQAKGLIDTVMKNLDGAGRRIKKASIRQKSSSPEGLPSHILDLRDRGFFKEPKVASEVHGKLKSNYHCALDRVVMALLRLQRRKQLRKSSKMIGKKQQVAYVW